MTAPLTCQTLLLNCSEIDSKNDIPQYFRENRDKVDNIETKATYKQHLNNIFRILQDSSGTVVKNFAPAWRCQDSMTHWPQIVVVRPIIKDLDSIVQMSNGSMAGIRNSNGIVMA